MSGGSSLRLPSRIARALAFGAAITALVATPLAAQATSFTTPARMGFAAGDDWEPAIAADAAGHVYALFTHYGPDPFCAGCGSPHSELQVSGDGGATWSDPRPIHPTTTRQDDPQILVDPAGSGTVYASWMENNKASEYVAKSTDFGESWTVALVEPLQRGIDKDILAARGADVYVSYHTQQKIYVSSSHDGGATWSLDRPVASTSKLGVSLPSGGAVAPDGTVYFAWAGYLGNGKPSGDVNLYVTRSLDHGATWSTSLVDVSQPNPACSCGGWAFWGAQIALAVDGGGTIYVLYNSSAVSGAPSRVFFARSIDHGATWSTPQDVSNAPTGANNVFPAMVAGSAGDVRIAWMDDRNGHDAGSDDPNARWNVFYRSSTDGGITWSSEAQVSQYASGYTYDFATPNEGFLQPYGDYFELDIDGDGQTQMIWGEGNSYVGPGNIWYARGS
jgi:hypothetical protein